MAFKQELLRLARNRPLRARQIDAKRLFRDGPDFAGRNPGVTLA